MDVSVISSKPKGLESYNFEPCDDIGGASFRHWCMLMRHKGVFIGFDNHDWIVLFSSDPNANFRRGCQNSCANGNPLPISDEATLITFGQIPEEAKPLAIRWTQEAIEIARTRIEAAEVKKAKRLAEEKAKKEEEYNNEIRQPWLTAVNKEEY
jgi:hypothetical protein